MTGRQVEVAGAPTIDARGPIDATVWRYDVVQARPIVVPWTDADGTASSRTITSFPMTVVALRDADGCLGLGYVMGGEPVEKAIESLLSERPLELSRFLSAADGPASSATLTEPIPGANAVAEAARAALSIAAWDLVGRRRGVACAALWSDEPATSLDAYYSGFFSDLTPEQVLVEAQEARDAGYTKVKMRAGLSAEADRERFAAIASVYGAQRTIAMDAVWGWSAGHAEQFLAGLGRELLWLEDPFLYDAEGLARYAALQGSLDRPLLSAGEASTSLAELEELRTAGGVQLLLPDVSCLGGIPEFLAVGRALCDEGAWVGAHLYPHVSAHLLACLPRTLPVEGAPWLSPAFITSLAPGPDGRFDVSGPGFGMEVDIERLSAEGQRLLHVRA